LILDDQNIQKSSIFIYVVAATAAAVQPIGLHL
jgi:hypothetical protein